MREFLLYGIEVTHARLMRCLEDLSDDEARRSPHGLSPVIWQAGHMALTDVNFARRADGTAEAPLGYAELFAMGTGGEAAYPPLAEVREAAVAAQRALEQAVRTVPLDAAVEGRGYATVGEMFAFALYHRGYHIGKVTTLRALLEKPRLFG
jgi:uncharacterized damage-inducible protein DinB